jgi:hypothetical protein
MQRFFTIWFWWISISFYLLGAGCEPVPEYRLSEEGYHWKLIAFSEERSRPDSVARVYAEIRVLDELETETLAYRFDRPFSGEDPLFRFLSTRYQGDSLKLIADCFDSLKAELGLRDTLVYYLRVDRIRSLKDLEDDRLKELDYLDRWIRIDSVKAAYAEIDGIYFRSLVPGDTAAVRRGNEIVIHYRGRTIQGEVFDDSRRMSAPLRFVYGTEGQVLPGIDVALANMHLGEKAEVILPSWMAFGRSGSADGRVKPYSTVIYQIEVLN